MAEEDRSSDLRKGRKDGQVSLYHSCEVQSWQERSGPFEVESLIFTSCPRMSSMTSVGAASREDGPWCERRDTSRRKVVSGKEEAGKEERKGSSSSQH